MSYQRSKNVWGKVNRNSENSRLRGSFKKEEKTDLGHGHNKSERENKKVANFTLGSFGSRSMFGQHSGPSSLPNETSNKRNSRMYNFELGNYSSDSSSSASPLGSGPNSLIGFGMEPKKFNRAWKGDQRMDVASGGSSRSSSGFGSRSHINLGNMVENVFMEEIGKMSETLQRGSCLWK